MRKVIHHTFKYFGKTKRQIIKSFAKDLHMGVCVCVRVLNGETSTYRVREREKE